MNSTFKGAVILPAEQKSQNAYKIRFIVAFSVFTERRICALALRIWGTFSIATRTTSMPATHNEVGMREKFSNSRQKASFDHISCIMAMHKAQIPWSCC